MIMDKYFLSIVLLIVISILVVLYIKIIGKKNSTVDLNKNIIEVGDNFTFLE
jgi:hypothetical protein